MGLGAATPSSRARDETVDVALSLVTRRGAYFLSLKRAITRSVMSVTPLV